VFARLVSFLERYKGASTVVAVGVVIATIVLLYHLHEALSWLHARITKLSEHPFFLWVVLAVFLILVILILAASYSVSGQALLLRGKESRIKELTSEIQKLDGRLAELRDQFQNLEKDKVQALEARVKRDEVIRNTFKRMMMTAYRITQQTSVGYPKKDILELTSTYLINAKYDGLVERVYRLKAVERLNFYEVNVRVESEAAPQEFLDDINFKVVDGDGNPLPYLPIENDPHRKVVAIFFLPPLEPGGERTIVISYKWPEMFKKLKVEGFERASWNLMKASAAPIGSLSFLFYVDPAVGKRLKCDPDGCALGTQDVRPSVHANGWPGFIYEITRADAGAYALKLELRE
jgi:hypothetical protein